MPMVDRGAEWSGGGEEGRRRGDKGEEDVG
jgi:hypothetical protein